VEYSLARLDSSFVTATPGTCVDTVAWRFDRLDKDASRRSAARVGIESRLFGTLSSPRRNTTGDELFNLIRDVQMTENLFDGNDAATIATERAVMERTFVSYFLQAGGPASFSFDEIERLRSLGYIR
jgi:hypothetical protein